MLLLLFCSFAVKTFAFSTDGETLHKESGKQASFDRYHCRKEKETFSISLHLAKYINMTSMKHAGFDVGGTSGAGLICHLTLAPV